MSNQIKILQHSYTDGESVVLTGTISNITKTEYGYKMHLRGENHSFLVYADNIENIYVNDCVSVSGSIEEFEQARNEGNYDERKYYYNKGIICAIKAEEITFVSRKSNIYIYLDNISKSIEAQLYKIAEKNDANIYRAMILGKKDGLSDETTKMYQKAGISHILAISGLHISLIGMSLYKALRALKQKYIYCCAISIALIIAYGVISGNSISTIRALAMFILTVCAQVIGRKYDIRTALAFAAIILLTKNPMYIFEAAFVLSFLAVVGISLLYTALEPEKRCLKGIVMGFAITFTTMPASLYYFYELPLYSVFINLLVIPLMTILFLTLLIGIVTSYFSVFLGTFIMATPHYILGMYEKLCEITEKLPMSNIIIGRPHIVGLVIFLVLYVLLCTFAKYLKAYWKIGIIFIMFVLLIFDYDKGDNVTMLDVGQGECIIMENNANVYMLDCGSTDIKNVAEYRVISHLKCRGISKIKMCFISHPDMDHISGILELLEKDSGIVIENIVISDDWEENENLNKLILSANEASTNIIKVKQGAVIRDKDFIFKVLHLKNGFDTTDTNEASLVLELLCKKTSFLFTGDIGIETEKYVEISRKYDVYKVAHHGSKYSNSDAFLQRINPKIALISAGRGNGYGHPHQETISRLNTIGSNIYVTAKCGQITLGIKDDELAVQGFLK